MLATWLLAALARSAPACALAATLALAPASPATADRPPVDPSIADELGRLVGHDVTIAADGKSYVIENIANEGKPHVGIVERRGPDLYLVTDAGPALRLTGVLAQPRIAGPGYKIWALGPVTPTNDLRAHRLGILAPPGDGVNKINKSASGR